MIIRALLVDDEAPARDELAYLLERFPDIVATEAPNAAEALKAIRADRPDLVFLDIEMPGKDGFFVLKEALCLPEPPLFVFVTAYSKYAVQAFEENAVDYLLKPVSTERLHKSVERVRALLRQKREERRQPELERLLGSMEQARGGLSAAVGAPGGSGMPDASGAAPMQGAAEGSAQARSASGQYASGQNAYGQHNSGQYAFGQQVPGQNGSADPVSNTAPDYPAPDHPISGHPVSDHLVPTHPAPAPPVPERPVLDRLAVEEGGRIQLVDISEVVYCERADRRLLIYTADNCHPCHGITALDELEERLRELPFFRANRGTVVNLRQVREFSPWTDGKYCLVMNDERGTEITLSRGRVKEFKERLGL